MNFKPMTYGDHLGYVYFNKDNGRYYGWLAKTPHVNMYSANSLTDLYKAFLDECRDLFDDPTEEDSLK